MEILYTDEFCEYGLCFDLVEAGTFNDQLEPYYRYQISYGGPSEEFRMYADRTEYWYLDWFDGASIDVTHDSRVDEIMQTFEDCEMIDRNLLTVNTCECGEIIDREEYECEECRFNNMEWNVAIDINGTHEETIKALKEMLEAIEGCEDYDSMYTADSGIIDMCITEA